MGNTIDSETNKVHAYYKKKYSEANPSTTNTVTYTKKKGDNLWSIAREKLNKKGAKNAEVQDMMYQIAKLNKMDSPDEANNLTINDIILLPAATSVIKSAPQASAKKQTVRDVRTTSADIKKIIEPAGLSYVEKMQYKYAHVKDIPDNLYTENGKAGIKYWTDMLKNNPKLKFEESYSTSPTKPSGLIITKKENDSMFGMTEATLLVQFDEHGKFKKVAFDSPGVNINNIKFDYELDTNGNLKKPINNYGDMKTLEKMNKYEYQQFIQALQEHIDDKIK